MMDWTDRHCRYFLRGFSPRVLLYSEMITAAAIMRGDAERLLRFSPEERPLALQLGGSDPALLAGAARLGAQAGYDEINLNCGCPSDRVHAGAFGACLMLEPARVADCVHALRAAVDLPVTVKMRIGVVAAAPAREQIARFDAEDYARLHAFAESIVAAGCETLIVHARKAMLGGLSPRENREVPPLRYEVVERLSHDFPGVSLVVNGGLRTGEQCLEALRWADGIMLGREAYHRPQLLAELHAQLFDDSGLVPTTATALERMGMYAERELSLGTPLRAITRHMLGLGSGQPGARRFRQLLSAAADTSSGRGARAGQALELLRAARLCLASS
jgi:tRNA-dihydrouridine synthase A